MIVTKGKFNTPGQRKLDEAGTLGVWRQTVYSLRVTYGKESKRKIYRFECFKGPRTTLPKLTDFK